MQVEQRDPLLMQCLQRLFNLPLQGGRLIITDPELEQIAEDVQRVSLGGGGTQETQEGTRQFRPVFA